jgi:HrpA-like RNA helicase
MSATLDVEAFLGFFSPRSPAEVAKAKPFDEPVAVYVEGRVHANQVLYTERSQKDYLDAAISTVLQVHMDEGAADGDILCFLTGQEEIVAKIFICAFICFRSSPGAFLQL